MKKNLPILLLLLAGIHASAQTVVQQFVAISSGAGTVTDMDLPDPTAAGSVLIAMPEQLSPDVKVLSVTDNAPDGGNTYKQVTGATSSCSKRALEVWYCENCKAGVTELKFHLSGHVMGSINAFLEVSGMALSSVLDGSAQITDGTGKSDGSQPGPRITTTASDFVIARYSSTSRAKGVTPAVWTHKPAYVYGVNLPAGTYQPTLIGAVPSGAYCMSMAAFKTAGSALASSSH